MDLSAVGVALELLAKASRALDSLREQSKSSKDATLKENISKLYDGFLDLKAAVIRVTEENAALRHKIAQQAEGRPEKPQAKQVGATNYYYLGEDGPFCQACYDRDHKLARLSPQQEFAGGTGRKCEVCNKVFFEVHKEPSPARVRFGGPY